MDNNPYELFQNWYNLACGTGIKEPNAMVLSTVTTDGHPASRVVLLKRIIENKLYFFTNYESRKAKQIDQHPQVSLLFHWHEPIHRQIRIEGIAGKSSREISQEYFSTRPRGSQIGAWASPQSHNIVDHDELKDRFQQIEKRFEGAEVPCPEFWGGFEIVPTKFEFWQSGEDRLHSRWLYTQDASGNWVKNLLAP